MSKNLTLCLSDTLKQRLKKRATVLGLTQAEIVRNGLIHELNKLGGDRCD